MITRNTLLLRSGLLNGRVTEESSLCLIKLNILYDVINSLECAGLHTHSPSDSIDCVTAESL